MYSNHHLGYTACVHICISGVELSSLSHHYLLELLCHVQVAGLASQMKRSCDCCKRYEGHLDGNMKCFRRRMTADFRHGMIIPNKFIDHFEGKISRTIELESRNGNIYAVEVSKHMNETFLWQCGWEAFVDAHRIEENDSLLFRHIEKSRFEVLVLDSDDCEKVFPCAGIKVTSCNAQESSADYVDISSSSGDDTTRSSRGERFATCERGDSSHSRKVAVNPSSSKDSGEDTDTAEEHAEHESSSELDGRQAPSSVPVCDYVLSRSQRSSLSGSQKERVTRLLQDVQAETCAFVAVMRLSSRNRALVIPKCFAEEHFPRESQNVTLQRPGKSKRWHPWFYTRTDQCGHALSGARWLDFLRDNGVQEGDICVFQPVKKGAAARSKFTVHLLRESLGASGSGTGGQKKRVRCTTTHGKTRVNTVKAAATSRVNKEQDDDDDTSRSSGSKRFAACERGDSSHPIKTAVNYYSSAEDSGEDTDAAEERSEHETSFEPDDDRQTPSWVRDYVLSRKTRLSGAQEEMVTRLLQDIRAQIPLFVAIMKLGSQNPRLVIPRCFAEEHFPCESQKVMLQCPGKNRKWHPWFYISKDRCGRLLSGPRWVEFLHDNGVQEGDICVLEPVKKGKFTVHLLRETLGASGSSGPKKRVRCAATATHGEPKVKSAATTRHDDKEQDDGCGQRARQPPKLAPPYMMSSASRLSLTREQEREVDRRVRAIGSRVPIYVSVMNRSSVGIAYNVTICGTYAAEYLPAGDRVAVTLVRAGRSNKAWEVELRARTGGAQRMVQGWRHFAGDNRLRVQDVCLFQLMKRKNLQGKVAMTVHIIRHDGKR